MYNNVPGDDADEISLGDIATKYGLDNALTAMGRCVEGTDTDLRMFSVWCLRQFEDRIADPGIMEVLDVLERHCKGEATDEERQRAVLDARQACVCYDYMSVEKVMWDACYHALGCKDASVSARKCSTAPRICFLTSEGEKAVLTAQKETFVRMCEGTASWQQSHDAEPAVARGRDR